MELGYQLLLWAALAGLSLVAAAWLLMASSSVLRGKTRVRFPPAVPGGVPVLGNFLQLREKKPYKTFAAWADKYGPIYTIKMGAQTMVVINSPEIAKEVLVTKHSSISTRKMPKALYILTSEKTMVAMSDYGDEHRMLKKVMVANLLGSTPQKANRYLREKASYQMIDGMFNELSKSKNLLNIRDYTKQAVFEFTMCQLFGRDPDFVFVKEFGRNVSREEMFQALVADPLQTLIEVDWRDFFPAFKWVPNKVEDTVRAVHEKINAIVGALISEQRQLLANGKKPECYLDVLLTEATHLTEKQLLMILWEPIIESVDTTMVTMEWAMFELAKDPAAQERLYEEISEVAGSRIVTEDDLPKLKFLDAIVKETLRTYAPVALLFPRHVDEDVQLGGFDIKRGWQIIINAHGINYSKDSWLKPEVWNPERVLRDERLALGFRDLRIFSFGAGKRMCAGITQAMHQIPMTIAYFVQHFKWALPPEDETKSVVDTTFLTTRKLLPLEAIATPRFPSRLSHSF